MQLKRRERRGSDESRLDGRRAERGFATGHDLRRRYRHHHIEFPVPASGLRIVTKDRRLHVIGYALLDAETHQRQLLFCIRRETVEIQHGNTNAGIRQDQGGIAPLATAILRNHAAHGGGELFRLENVIPRRRHGDNAPIKRPEIELRIFCRPGHGHTGFGELESESGRRVAPESGERKVHKT